MDQRRLIGFNRRGREIIVVEEEFVLDMFEFVFTDNADGLCGIERSRRI